MGSMRASCSSHRWRATPTCRTGVPATLRDATDRFTASEVARAAFGDDVVEHYTHAARVEQAAFDVAVTDWERVRGFERL